MYFSLMNFFLTDVSRWLLGMSNYSAALISSHVGAQGKQSALVCDMPFSWQRQITRETDDGNMNCFLKLLMGRAIHPVLSLFLAKTRTRPRPSQQGWGSLMLPGNIALRMVTDRNTWWHILSHSFFMNVATINTSFLANPTTRLKSRAKKRNFN